MQLLIKVTEQTTYLDRISQNLRCPCPDLGLTLEYSGFHMIKITVELKGAYVLQFASLKINVLNDMCLAKILDVSGVGKTPSTPVGALLHRVILKFWNLCFVSVEQS